MAVITGTPGNDTLTQNPSEDDQIDGLDGIDRIDLRAMSEGARLDLRSTSNQLIGPNQGIDRVINIENILGTAFDDRFVAILSGSDIRAGAGHDTLIGQDGADTLLGEDGDDRIIGNGGDDRLFGGGGADVITAEEGNDTVRGGTGDDVVRGRAGDDTIFGDDGNDNLAGEEGADRISGNAGNDFISGGADNDVLSGEAGQDDLRGGTGDDRLNGGDDDDVLLGEDGRDILSGDGGNDTLYGGDDDDTVKGGAGDDYVRGDAGNDRLVGDEGADQLFGGTGDDIISAETGADTLHGMAGADRLYGNEDDDTLFGGTEDDVLYGGSGNDILDGGAGQDTELGGEGDDVFIGSVGNDRIAGGAGQDLIDYSAGGGGLIVTLNNGAAQTINVGLGNDRITGIEGFILPNFASDVTGDDQDNVFVGGSADDVMRGGAGSDRLVSASNAGDTNTLSGGSGDDTFALEERLQTVIITDFTSGEDLIALTHFTPIADFSELLGFLVAPDTFQIGDLTLILQGLDIASDTVESDYVLLFNGNHPANAVDDTATAGALDGPAVIDVLGNDNDPEGDGFTLVSVDDGGTRGDVSLAGGIVSYSPNGQFTELGAGTSATDSFTYTIEDHLGRLDTATVTITITGVNEGPNANDGAAAADEDSVENGIAANFTDPDAGDVFSFTIDTSSTTGIVINQGDGTFDYDPNGQFDGLQVGDTATDSFTYTVEDSEGATDTAIITITIAGVNDAPDAMDVAATTDEDTVLTGLLAHVTDPDDTMFTYAIDTTGTTGLVTDNGDGTFDYDPNRQFEHLSPGESATDSFIYTVEDAGGAMDSATITVTITGVNDAPRLTLGAADVTADENQTAVPSLNPSVHDPDDTEFTYLILLGYDGHHFTIDETTGQLTFVDAPDFENPGDDDTNNVYDVRILVSDGTTSSNTGRATVTVNDLPDSPNIRIADLTPDLGFYLYDTEDFARLGSGVDIVADMNGDGLADIVAGAPLKGFSSAHGEVFVLYGSGSSYAASDGAGRAGIDTATITAPSGLNVRSTNYDDIGEEVASAGDVNGDGLEDVIIGAPDWKNSSSTTFGGAYVIFGSETARPDISLSSLDPLDGFLIVSETNRDFELGFDVSSAGDVNNDGYDDVMIGAPFSEIGGDDDVGRAFVIFGGPGTFGTPDGSGRSTLDVGGLLPAQGFVIVGAAAEDQLGYSVSSIGDINGDGIDDIAIGAKNTSTNGNYSGETYVIYGTEGGFGVVDATGRAIIDVGNLSPTTGFVIQGSTKYTNSGDALGHSLGAAGDVNGDGFSDLIVGANEVLEEVGVIGKSTGEAYVIYGTDSGFGSLDAAGRAVVQTEFLSAGEGFVISGDWGLGQVRLGETLAGAGDVNGDGFDDVMVAAFAAGPEGRVHVIYGGPAAPGITDGNGRQVFETSTMSEQTGFTVFGESLAVRFGASVDGGGDVNGDGFEDIIIGANRGDEGADEGGEAYIVYGRLLAASDTPVIQTGTAAAEVLIGGAGNDDISGMGGADVVRTGAGDDSVTVADADFFFIDGGTGLDRLVIDGLGGLALSDVAANLEDIEMFDLSGATADTLTIESAVLVTNLSATSNALFAMGGGSDTVALAASFTADQIGQDALGSGVLFNSYVDGNATVWVEQGVMVDILP